MSVPPSIHKVKALTVDEETGEMVDHLAGLRDDELLGAQVFALSRHELGSDGEMYPVLKGGTVVFYDEATVTTVAPSVRYGKTDVKVDIIGYEEILPEHNRPGSHGQRHKLARHICKVLGAKRGNLEGFDLKLIGYAAALARR